MRILIWMTNFWPMVGGIEVHATKFLPALQKRGHEFLVIASQGDPNLPEKDNFQGIPVHRFPFWKARNDLDYVVKVRREVKRIKQVFQPDLIHRNSVGVGDFFNLTTTNVYPAPLLVTLRGKWSHEVDGLVTQTLRAAHWVVGCSQTILNHGLELAPEVSSRSSIIFNSFEDPDLVPSPLLCHPPRLLCLGRLSPEKGFDLALIALASLAKKYQAIRLVIAGDGPCRKALEQQADELGIRHIVEFTGWVPPGQVSQYINSASLVVMPSRRESFPIVAIQAAQMARPVIGTNVGGLPEVVLSKQTGWLIEPEDPQGLAATIQYFLEHSHIAVEMGQRARTRINNEFSWERHIDAYDHLYRELSHSWKMKRQKPILQHSLT